MSLKIKIKTVHLILLTLVLIGIVIGYGTKNPVQFGHSGKEADVMLSNGSMTNLDNYVNTGSSDLPSGTFMFFNQSTCPGGWTRYGKAEGRYIVGLVDNGTLGSEVGIKLSNLENRFFNAHTHNVTILDETTTTTNGYKRVKYTRSSKLTAARHIDVSNPYLISQGSTTSTTNQPYIQLLGCVKS